MVRKSNLRSSRRIRDLGHNIISSFSLIRQLFAILPIIQRVAWIYLKKTSKGIKSNFRGSSRDPLLYLGVFAVLLFGFLILKTSFFFPKEDFFSLTSQKLSSLATKGNLFIDQDKLEKPEMPLLNITQNNSLVGISSPVLISPKVLGILGDFEEKKEIFEHIVQPGDNLSKISEKFNISLNTLLWANDLNTNSIIKPGESLIILPISGVLHHVKKGETLSEIAKKYQGDVAEIISFNEIPGEDIFVGDILIIPDGKLPPKPRYSQSAISQIPLASSYFIFPTQGKISQGLHWYNAVDIANGCGNPVYSAAEGEVLSVKYGYNLGAGNYIKILHTNGAVTFYGHLGNILVAASQSVSQGHIIGLIGGKPGTPGAGRSTGCHLHFEVRGARNPFG